mmetsp:Transcript_34276/g.79088  ORF Transcript_34276/g.79088 Transcript_34276/m.79088 type:complete len:98 (+) Transcript_34276:3-296(+)
MHFRCVCRMFTTIMLQADISSLSLLAPNPRIFQKHGWKIELQTQREAGRFSLSSSPTQVGEAYFHLFGTINPSSERNRASHAQEQIIINTLYDTGQQ